MPNLCQKKWANLENNPVFLCFFFHFSEQKGLCGRKTKFAINLHIDSGLQTFSRSGTYVLRKPLWFSALSAPPPWMLRATSVTAPSTHGAATVRPRSEGGQTTLDIGIKKNLQFQIYFIILMMKMSKKK